MKPKSNKSENEIYPETYIIEESPHLPSIHTPSSSSAQRFGRSFFRLLCVCYCYPYQLFTYDTIITISFSLSPQSPSLACRYFVLSLMLAAASSWIGIGFVVVVKAAAEDETRCFAGLRKEKDFLQRCHPPLRSVRVRTLQ